MVVDMGMAGAAVGTTLGRSAGTRTGAGKLLLPDGAVGMALFSKTYFATPELFRNNVSDQMTFEILLSVTTN